MYHVRFHLAKGRNYLKWQIKNTNSGDVRYYDPELYELIMVECKLINHKKIAEKIYDGANKEVCAWISCRSVIPLTNTKKTRNENSQIIYNPKIYPYWIKKETEENIDNESFSYLVTKGKKLFFLEDTYGINTEERDVYAKKEIS